MDTPTGSNTTDSLTKTDVLKQKRVTTRGLTTKLIKKIEHNLKKTVLDEEELKDNLSELQSKEFRLSELDDELGMQINDLQLIEDDLITSDTYSNNIRKARDKIRNALEMIEKGNASSQNANSASSQNVTQTQSPNLNITQPFSIGSGFTSGITTTPFTTSAPLQPTTIGSGYLPSFISPLSQLGLQASPGSANAVQPGSTVSHLGGTGFGIPNTTTSAITTPSPFTIGASNIGSYPRFNSPLSQWSTQRSQGSANTALPYPSGGNIGGFFGAPSTTTAPFPPPLYTSGVTSMGQAMTSSVGHQPPQPPTQQWYGMKLPEIKVYSFDGESKDVSKWTEFWGRYEVSIHNNNTLSNVQKLIYLRSYLEGTAFNHIGRLEVNDANYDVAITRLKNRFGRKDALIHNHIQNLYELTPVRKDSDIKALRKLYDTCEGEITALELIGSNFNEYGPVLCPLILKLIPMEITLQYSRNRNSDRPWDIKELLSVLRNEVESRERASIYVMSSKDGNTTQKPTPKKKADSFYRTNSVQSTILTSSSSSARCLFCRLTNHTYETCKVLVPSKKKELLKKQGRCYICVTGRHLAKRCRVKIECKVCSGRHHTTLCDESDITTEGTSEQQEEKEDKKSSQETTVTSAALTEPESESILLQTVTVQAIGNSDLENIRCLLDSGSQRTYVLKDLSEKLGFVSDTEETLDVHAFGGGPSQLLNCRRVKVTLKSLFDDQFLEIKALEIPIISMANLQVPGRKVREKMKSMGLNLGDQPRTDLQGEQPLGILIGADYYWQALTGHHRRIDANLMALESKFGWVVHGPETSSALVTSSQKTSVSVNLVTTEEIEVVGKELRRFWELESIGIRENEMENFASEDLVRKFENKVTMKGGRYEVEFPWKEERRDLSNNYDLAKKRLKGLLKRLNSNPSLLEDYHRIFKEYAQEGIIEEIVESEIERRRKDVFYLPHHPVIKEERATSKIRIVFDGSAHEKDHPSLNDCLESGPNLNPDLYNILINFRKNKIAVTADIKQAFLQISIAQEERDFVRFLWIDGLEFTDIKLWRFTRVLFGLTCSPFLLNATIRFHAKKLEETYPESCKKIREEIYVDDLITGGKDDEEAKMIVSETTEILKDAGMSLRKFQTNSPALRVHLNQLIEPQPKEEKTIFQNPENNKVLGLTWSPRTDCFSFEVTGLLKMLQNFVNTKRSVLSAASRIFDPIGFVTPFTITIKTLFQCLWREGVGWDEELPAHISSQWNNWSSQLKELEDIQVSRYYYKLAGEQRVKESQLHVFCDASETAYGCVAYIRFKFEDGLFETAFVSSKARVTPIKRITLPRLELLGALTGARLAERLGKILLINKSNVYLWTDSTVTYFWIKGNPRDWKPFVANRVSEIQRLSEPQSWHHCRGIENPADFLTRGLQLRELAIARPWWKGPSWLLLREDEWPQTNLTKVKEITEEVEVETRNKAKVISALTSIEQNRQLNAIFTLENYSDIRKILKVTAWSQRFIYNLKHRDNKIEGPLSAEELEKAENYWNRVVQEEIFSEELNQLKNGAPIKNSFISELDPFIDEKGIMRVGGRLQKSQFSYSVKHPIILPYKHCYSELQTKFAHQVVCHSGTSDTLIQVREKFWIQKGRQLAKNCVNRCYICRRWKLKHCVPKTAPMPRDRLTDSKAFEIIGLDYAGPVYIKDWKVTRKSYILLITCANTRAVHLELISNQTSEYFLLAFKRFISRRGVPSIIYSDNAKTFKRAEKELVSIWKAMTSEKVKAFFANFRITWKYIVERGPWWGGFYERLVSSVKVPLRKIVGRALLNFEELSTVLTEIEAVINSRPLTYTYSDPNDPSPLTPSHFLIGGRLTSIPPFRASFPNNTIPKPDELKKRLAYQQRLTDRFWTRWKKEYILQLQSVHKLKSQENGHSITKGDVVLLDDENTPRTKWKLARVESVTAGRDGHVRSCELKLAKGGTVKRPINQVCPLEIEH